jgi:16S rRNA U1498 N3-methylase RsmE
MKPLLLILSLFFISNNCFSQPPVQLQLKKNGHVKKRIQIGDEILVATKQNEIFKGNIFKLTKDSISFRFATVALNSVSYIKFINMKRVPLV